MKLKLILGIWLILFISSCGNKEAEQRAEKVKEEGLSIPQKITLVSTIGKIEPEDGLISISSEKGGVVLKVLKTAGDSVSMGEAILLIKSEAESDNENILLNQVRVKQKHAEVDFSNILQYEIQEDEKLKDLEVSERLFKSGAETQQNIEIKTKELKVLQANLKTAKKNAIASVADIAVLQAQLKQAKYFTKNMTVRAVQNGILTTMEAKPGAAILPLSSFATLAASGKVVVHGEIDEMFASRVSLGNNVSISSPGSKKQLAKGKIIFLSPILEDKSIFYELAGERNDRRVRRFKAELENPDGLLINQKVQCDIKVD